MTEARGFLLFDHGRMGRTHSYAVYIPKQWDGASLLPAIVYLHGSGESGTDGVRQLLIGLPRAVIDAQHRWPFLIVAPQKESGDSEWFDQRDWLSEVLSVVEQSWPIDHSRCYLTGLSQGGRGTFRLADQLPWNFAAAAPVCGWVDPDEAVGKLLNVPIWAFHGDADDVVPLVGTTAAIDALVDAGGDAQVTVYPGIGHNSWDLAYAAELPEWFLAHTR